MSSLERLGELEARYAMPTYARAPVEFVRGAGARLWDSADREYLDFFSGLSVHNFGHCHPQIVAAIQDQAGRFAGSSNLFYSEPALELCRRLSESSLGGRVFLANTGAEANECAIKLIRKHAHRRGVEDPRIVVLDAAFHGRTLATLAATPRLADEELFGPLPRCFVAVDRDDPEALRRAVDERTAAVFIEPIQGEAGVHPVPEPVLVAAREACDRSGALLAFDEIQTGMGRTGTLWAGEQLPVAPDLMTAAKALGGGLPVGACVTSADLGPGLELGEHGSTFAGGPIPARAALTALALAEDEHLLAESRQRAEQLREALDGLPGVLELRGRGLMIGIGLEAGLEAGDIQRAALRGGLVVNAPNPRTIRLLPPLTLTAAEADRGAELLCGAIEQGGGDRRAGSAGGG